MCGIVTLFGEKRDVPGDLLTHRGPDDYRRETMGKCQMDYYRLAINDLTDAAMQPFVRPHRMFACNGAPQRCCGPTPTSAASHLQPFTTFG